MKIDKPVEIQSTPDAALRSGQAAGAARSAARGRAAAPAAGETDSVSLSAASRAPKADADVRADKVAEVREAIREGRFHVSAEVVADKMIAQAAELLETLSVPRR